MNSLPDDWLTTHEIQALIERLRRSLCWSTSILQPSSLLLEHSPTAVLDIQSDKSSSTRACRLDTACGFAEYSRTDKTWAVHHYALDSPRDETTSLSTSQKRRRRNAPCIATLKSTKRDEVSAPSDIVQLLLRKEELSWMLNSAKMERQKGSRLCLICTTRQGVQIDLSSIVKQLTTGSRFVDLLAKVVMGNESWSMLNSVTNDWEVRRRCFNGGSSPSLYHLRLRRREPNKPRIPEDVEFDVEMDRNKTHDNRRTAKTDHKHARVLDNSLSEQQRTAVSSSNRPVSISKRVESVPGSTGNSSLRNTAKADKSQADNDLYSKHQLSRDHVVLVQCDNLPSHPSKHPQSQHPQSPQIDARSTATEDLPLAVRRTRRSPCLTRKLALLESDKKTSQKVLPIEDVALYKQNDSQEEQAPVLSGEAICDVSTNTEENLSKPQQSPRRRSRKSKDMSFNEQTKDTLATEYEAKETFTGPQSPRRSSRNSQGVSVDEQMKDIRISKASKEDDDNTNSVNDKKSFTQTLSPRRSSRKSKGETVDEQTKELQVSEEDDANADSVNDKKAFTRPQQSPKRASRKHMEKVHQGNNVTEDEQTDSLSIQGSKYEESDMIQGTKTFHKHEQSPRRTSRKRNRGGQVDKTMPVHEHNESLAGQNFKHKFATGGISNMTEDSNTPQHALRRSSRKRAREAYPVSTEHEDFTDDTSCSKKSLIQTQHSLTRSTRSTRASLNKNANNIQEKAVQEERAMRTRSKASGSDSRDMNDGNGDQQGIQASLLQRSKRHQTVQTIVGSSGRVRPRMKRLSKMAVISYRISDEDVENLQEFLKNNHAEEPAQSTLEIHDYESDESDIDLESMRQLPISTMQLRPERLIREYRDLYNFYASVLPAAFDPKDPFINHRVKEKLSELGENGVEVEESEDVKADNQLYFRSVKGYKNKADSERIDKQREKEQLQLVLRELAYKERGKKKQKITAAEQECQDFETRPFMYIHPKKDRNECENSSCVICRRDDEQKHPAAKLMPGVKEIAVYAPDFAMRDDDGSEEQSGSRNRRRRSKRGFCIRQETVMKLTEIKHSMEFIDAYNSGLLDEVEH